MNELSQICAGEIIAKTEDGFQVKVTDGIKKVPEGTTLNLEHKTCCTKRAGRGRKRPAIDRKQAHQGEPPKVGDVIIVEVGTTMQKGPGSVAGPELIHTGAWAIYEAA